jgi:hypothetical protein
MFPDLTKLARPERVLQIGVDAKKARLPFIANAKLTDLPSDILAHEIFKHVIADEMGLELCAAVENWCRAHGRVCDDQSYLMALETFGLHIPANTPKDVLAWIRTPFVERGMRSWKDVFVNVCENLKALLPVHRFAFAIQVPFFKRYQFLVAQRFYDVMVRDFRAEDPSTQPSHARAPAIATLMEVCWRAQPATIQYVARHGELPVVDDITSMTRIELYRELWTAMGRILKEDTHPTTAVNLVRDVLNAGYTEMLGNSGSVSIVQMMNTWQFITVPHARPRPWRIEMPEPHTASALVRQKSAMAVFMMLLDNESVFSSCYLGGRWRLQRFSERLRSVDDIFVCALRAGMPLLVLKAIMDRCREFDTRHPQFAKHRAYWLRKFDINALRIAQLDVRRVIDALHAEGAGPPTLSSNVEVLMPILSYAIVSANAYMDFARLTRIPREALYGADHASATVSDVVALLLREGARIDAPSGIGWSCRPFQLANALGHFHICTELLFSDQHITFVPEDAWSVGFRRSKSIIGLMAKRGYDINAPVTADTDLSVFRAVPGNDDAGYAPQIGETPLEHARRTHQDDLVEWLTAEL